MAFSFFKLFEYLNQFIFENHLVF